MASSPSTSEDGETPGPTSWRYWLAWADLIFELPTVVLGTLTFLFIALWALTDSLVWAAVLSPPIAYGAVVVVDLVIRAWRSID